MDDVRLANYITLIKNINKVIGNGFLFEDEINEDIERGLFESSSRVTPLQVIYDYSQCNTYAKVIMCISKYSFNKLNQENDSYCVDKKGIKNAKKFVQFCLKSENVKDGYKFIFWALMILTVDKGDAEKHLSLICDYAKMLWIADSEFEDIIQIVKIIYNQCQSYQFKSEKIPRIFGKLLSLAKTGVYEESWKLEEVVDLIENTSEEILARDSKIIADFLK